jgi:putative addiction module component (TIGR02574 family)
LQKSIELLYYSPQGVQHVLRNTISSGGFDELTADEQVEYVQELWDYIVDSRSGQISIPDWHREILEERMAQYRENGDEGIPFEQFEKELFEQLKKG